MVSQTSEYCEDPNIPQGDGEKLRPIPELTGMKQGGTFLLP
jgi:hypothetical protein